MGRCARNGQLALVGEVARHLARLGTLRRSGPPGGLTRGTRQDGAGGREAETSRIDGRRRRNRRLTRERGHGARIGRGGVRRLRARTVEVAGVHGGKVVVGGLGPVLGVRGRLGPILGGSFHGLGPVFGPCGFLGGGLRGSGGALALRLVGIGQRLRVRGDYGRLSAEVLHLGHAHVGFRGGLAPILVGGFDGRLGFGLERVRGLRGRGGLGLHALQLADIDLARRGLTRGQRLAREHDALVDRLGHPTQLEAVEVDVEASARIALLSAIDGGQDAGLTLQSRAAIDEQHGEIHPLSVGESAGAVEDETIFVDAIYQPSGELREVLEMRRNGEGFRHDVPCSFSSSGRVWAVSPSARSASTRSSASSSLRVPRR